MMVPVIRCGVPQMLAGTVCFSGWGIGCCGLMRNWYAAILRKLLLVLWLPCGN